MLKAARAITGLLKHCVEVEGGGSRAEEAAEQADSADLMCQNAGATALPSASSSCSSMSCTDRAAQAACKALADLLVVQEPCGRVVVEGGGVASLVALLDFKGAAAAAVAAAANASLPMSTPESLSSSSVVLTELEMLAAECLLRLLELCLASEVVFSEVRSEKTRSRQEVFLTCCEVLESVRL